MLQQILKRSALGENRKFSSGNYLSVLSYSTDEKNKPIQEKINPGRVPWEKQEGEWYSAFKLFAPEKGIGPDVVRFLQSPIDLRPSTVRKWWWRKKEKEEILYQGYIPERHQILGNDLASAHFIVYRGGSVKFLGSNEWIKKNEDDEYDLPRKFVKDMYLEAIDASNMRIHYEGLRNLFGLKHLKWLSFNNCVYFDDWCIDRISGEFYSSLEYLDLSNCHGVSELGLSVLHRLEKLQTLKVFNISDSKPFQLTCLLLEDMRPNLKIEGVEYMMVDFNSS